MGARGGRVVAVVAGGSGGAGLSLRDGPTNGTHHGTKATGAHVLPELHAEAPTGKPSIDPEVPSFLGLILLRGNTAEVGPLLFFKAVQCELCLHLFLNIFYM